MKILAVAASSVLISLIAPVANGQTVKAKTYESIPAGTTTYHWRPGRVLTDKGLNDNPMVDAIVRKAVEQQMNSRGFTEVTGTGGLEVSYMGGVSTALQIDDPTLGDYMTLNIGGSFGVQGYTYKKSGLVITVVDRVTGKAAWAALATDNFGQVSQLEQRIDKAVTKSFDKFPVKKK